MRSWLSGIAFASFLSGLWFESHRTRFLHLFQISVSPRSGSFAQGIPNRLSKGGVVIPGENGEEPGERAEPAADTRDKCRAAAGRGAETGEGAASGGQEGVIR